MANARNSAAPSSFQTPADVTDTLSIPALASMPKKAA
jgi:hypothetical protein